ncbi:MAG: hypothetical protein KDK05_23825, partial [Candidatus Competibacteraceae bacterium]|nr:hypothetical protein [Candidatus Competibacteraceae bacterium]
ALYSAANTSALFNFDISIASLIIASQLMPLHKRGGAVSLSDCGLLTLIGSLTLYGLLGDSGIARRVI